MVTTSKSSAIITGISALDSRPLWSGGRDYSLETPTALLRALGNPQDDVPSVHIAGTNGKGSVCAFLSHIFDEAGFQVGQFTSPHLSSVQERCLLNNRPVDFESFKKSVEFCAKVADDYDLDPSFFELTSAASFLEFSRRKLDWAVIETGLGGRLDATNTMLAPRVTVITNVDYDHEHILGPGLERIAKEKAGILRQAVPLVLGPMAEAPLAVIREIAKRSGVEVFECGEGAEFSEIGLRGRHQVSNANVAAKAAELCGIQPDKIREGIAKTSWPGRMERLRLENGSEVILDCAHNVAGVSALLTHLEEIAFRGPLLVALGQKKDWKGMLEVLRSYREKIGREVELYAARSPHHLSLGPGEIISELGWGEALSDLEAVHELIQRKPISVVFGSIFFVGALRPRLL